ncbi:MAG: HAMP domain-containing histidine kinase [Acidobacteriota bacterium]|nr:HAMP domain-containing histidine kinase [Acidobacteriota bacterium]
MNRLRNRLIVVFLCVTILPLIATLWMTTSLLDRSTSTRELDEVSKSLQTIGREYYRHASEGLKADALSGHAAPRRLAIADRARWPDAFGEFWDGGESERFLRSGVKGGVLQYVVRQRAGIAVYSRDLGIGMDELSAQYRRARELVGRNLRRGFIYTYVVLTAGIWLVSLGLLVFLANRVSRPIQQLTAGLSELAAGNFAARILNDREDEVGRATEAFNHTAAQLEHSRDRLVYLTQLASWQVLARKMAHEVKNSLTPIRLTVEEMVARHSEGNRAFLEEAAQIVVDEVESLERRVRAFSEFSAEPPVCPSKIDVNAMVGERIAFLKSGHPEVNYIARLAENAPRVLADEDLVKGILMNLLENAAEAAGDGGRILAATSAVNGHVEIEIHDSGPGLSEQARKSLFQPAISFKKRGMGLGLSIARKSALLTGGDILLVAGELGGAGFRVVLPVAMNGFQENPHS